MLAVGLLTSDGSTDERGTAFAFSRRAALTAGHCVSGLSAGEHVQIRLAGAEPLAARVGLVSVHLDLALLELVDDLPAGCDAVSIASRSGDLDGAPFLARGYPAARPHTTDRLAIDGNVVDAAATYADGVPGLQLHSRQVGEGFEPGGLSGAPVMVRMRTSSAAARWTAIGVITQGAVRPEGGVGYGGTIFATPLDATGWPAVDAELVDGVSSALYNEALIREFVAEYLGSATRSVPFGGRAAELAQLSEWLREPGCPTLLVTGGPGAGKSALLANFAAALDESAGVEVVYVPITVRFGMSAETTVLRAVVMRLGALHGETPSCADAAEWRETLARYLAAPLESQRTVIVILDGLDEAVGWQPGRWLLPPRDVPRVKVLFAARSLDTGAGGGWLAQLGGDARIVRPLALGPLNETGIEHVLQSAALLPADEEDARQVCSKLADLSRGDALVLSLYVEDALEREGPLTVDALGRQPAGLGGYVERWWAEQAELWGASLGNQILTVRLVLNLLACALGPLERRDLLGLARQRAEIDGDALDDALTALRRFVVRTARGWTMSHPALAEHRMAKLEEDRDLRDVHELFAQWGTSLVDGSAEIPSYVVYHLAAHLEAAGAGPDEFARFANDRWRLAWESESDEPGGNVRDARRARKVMLGADRARVAAGHQPALLVNAFRCMWAIATASEAVTDFPYALAAQMVRHRLWTPLRVLSFVRAQETSDHRALALAPVAPYLDAEATVAGIELLIKALDEATDYPDAHIHAEALGTLVVRLAMLDHVRTARGLTAGVSGEVRAFASLQLAIAVPDDYGLLAAALRDVHACGDDISYWVLDPLIEQVSAERVEQALAPAEDGAPVAGSAVAWLTERGFYDVRDNVAHVAELDCDELRTALGLVESADVGYRSTKQEVDLLLRLAECQHGDERVQTEKRALAAIPDVLTIPSVDDRNELLPQLARLDPERVIHRLASLPADDWYTHEGLISLAPTLDAAATRQAMDVADSVRWETRRRALEALASRLAEFGVAETHEALSILSSGAAREEQRAALVVLDACANGKAVAAADVLAITDNDLRAAVMIAAAHAGVLSPPAVYAGLSSFGNAQGVIETFAALSSAPLAWDDERVLAAVEEVIFDVSYERKGAALIPCFAHMARTAGKQATLEFAARLGKHAPVAAAWVVAGARQVLELSIDDLWVAGLWGVNSEPLGDVLGFLVVVKDPEAEVDRLPSALVRPADWAVVVGLLPGNVREVAIRTIPDSFWNGPSRDERPWVSAALAFVPVLTRERVDMLRAVTPHVGSATAKAELGAAFALRLAELGDPAAALAEARSITRGEFFARAVADMIPAFPAPELRTWLTTVLEQFADRHSRERARSLACALPRLLALDPASLWSLIELWLSEDLSRSQMLTDLITLGPLVQRLSGSDAAAGLGRWAGGLPA